MAWITIADSTAAATYIADASKWTITENVLEYQDVTSTYFDPITEAEVTATYQRSMTRIKKWTGGLLYASAVLIKDGYPATSGHIIAKTIARENESGSYRVNIDDFYPSAWE
jgi:hypothetical protein